MCKQYTAEHYFTEEGQLDKIRDLRVTHDTFPTDSENLYKVCLTGLRRQSY